MKSLGLIGRKVGMMRIFTDDGVSLPVTVLDVSDNYVAHLMTQERHGYSAVQIAFGKQKKSRVLQPVLGQYVRAGIEPALIMKEFRASADVVSALNIGQALLANLFSVGQKIDVRGVSIGKGYAGTIKRYNFASGRASHGNSKSHNVPGSIGMAQDPGRVFPGKRMTGHMGDERVAVQNLGVVRVDEGRQLIFVKGGIPGAKGGYVVITPAIKFALKRDWRGLI